MKIKCIIIDDEPLAINILKSFSKEFKNIEVLGSFNNPIEALNLLENNSIDVIFLDINMPEINGLELIKSLSSKALIVLTTAYREYAVESYQLGVFDYLIKPIPFKRFLKSITKIDEFLHLQKNRNYPTKIDEKVFFFYKVDKKLIKVKFDTILYIESLKDYVRIFTESEDYIVHSSLTSITKALPPKNFIRIHKSFIISISKVKFIEGNTVNIASKRLPIGRKYVTEAKKTILSPALFVQGQ
ncbi:LytR/AlgR family response regulator transcription factor [Mariniflexile ostreae]|uniref:LytR/AlgR family response regulator transcription factor n=1 Tax=Mariniflexile ostreae TaxID=1520892 RepID=A0ABV5FGL5_9FLAO